MASILSRLKTAKSGDGSLQAANGFFRVPTAKLVFDPEQPRKTFHALDGLVDPVEIEALNGLAAAMAGPSGQLEPIVVEEMTDNGDVFYKIIVGERRSRAALLLGWDFIDARFQKFEDEGEKRAAQLVENMQREGLSEIDTANAINDLIQRFGYTPVRLVKETGIALSWVTKYRRMAEKPVQDKWVLTGIASSSDVVYRLTLLPEDLQEEIQSRVAKPVDDAHALVTPLTREALLYYERVAKTRREMERTVAAAPSAVPVGASAAPVVTVSVTPASTAAATGSGADPVGADPLASAVADYMRQESEERVVAVSASASAASSAVVMGSADDGGFSMPEDVAASLRAPTASSDAGYGHPVRAEASYGLVAKLFEELRNMDADELAAVGMDMEAIDEIRVEVKLPTRVADLLCRQTGGGAPQEGRRTSVELQEVFAQLQARG